MPTFQMACRIGFVKQAIRCGKKQRIHVQGSRRNGLVHGLNFCAEEFGLEGLNGRAMDVGDTGDVGDLGSPGEVGEPGGIGAFLGDSYDVLMNGGVGCSNVRIEALSSSSIPESVIRSE